MPRSGHRAPPPTRAGAHVPLVDNPWREDIDRQLGENPLIEDDNLLSITGHDDGRLALPMRPEELKAKLWQLFGSKEILWDEPYDYEIKAKVAAAFKAAANEVQVVVGGVPKSGKAALAERVLEDIGMGAVPGLRTGTAVMNLLAEAASLILGIKDKGAVGEFSDIESERSLLEALGKDAVVMELSRSITKHGILVGTYAYDVGTSVVDFTGLSLLPSVMARAVRSAWDLRRHRNMVQAANRALNDEAAFTTDIFKKVPLLGCELMHKLPAADIMGIFDALYLPELEGRDRKLIINTLSKRDQTAIATYTGKIAKVKGIAKKTVETAPYCLPQELKRRGRRGLKGRAVDNLPSFLRSSDDDGGNDYEGFNGSESL